MADVLRRQSEAFAAKDAQALEKCRLKEAQEEEERRIYETGRNDRATANHRYSTQIAKLNEDLNKNAAYQKDTKASLEAHALRFWLRLRDVKDLSKELFDISLKDFLCWASPCIVEIHELEDERMDKTDDLCATEEKMLDNRELDKQIEVARKIKSFEDNGLPDDAVVACVKRPAPRTDVGEIPESVSSSIPIQPARKAQHARPIRHSRLGQPAQCSPLSQCTQPAELIQTDQPDKSDAAVQSTQSTQSTQAAISAQFARPDQPTQHVQTTQPALPVQSAQPAHQFYLIQPTQPADDTQSDQLVQPADSARTAQPIDPSRSPQPAQPTTCSQFTRLSSLNLLRSPKRLSFLIQVWHMT